MVSKVNQHTLVNTPWGDSLVSLLLFEEIMSKLGYWHCWLHLNIAKQVYKDIGEVRLFYDECELIQLLPKDEIVLAFKIAWSRASGYMRDLSYRLTLPSVISDDKGRQYQYTHDIVYRSLIQPFKELILRIDISEIVYAYLSALVYPEISLLSDSRLIRYTAKATISKQEVKCPRYQARYIILGERLPK